MKTVSNLVKAISELFMKRWSMEERGSHFLAKPQQAVALSGMALVQRPLSGITPSLISWCRRLCSLTTGFYPCERPRIAVATWEQSSPQGLIIVPDKQRGWSQHVIAVFNRDKWWADVPEWHHGQGWGNWTKASRPGSGHLLYIIGLMPRDFGLWGINMMDLESLPSRQVRQDRPTGFWLC